VITEAPAASRRRQRRGGGTIRPKRARGLLGAHWEEGARDLEGDFPVVVSLDLEATGLSSAIDHVIEIGAVRFRGSEVLDRWQTLVNPGIHVPGMIRRLTGIDDAELKRAPRLEQVVPELREFLGDAAILAHGAGYDAVFLEEALGEAPGDRLVFDSLDLARVLCPAAPSYSLGALCELTGLRHPRPHHALEDAEATYRLFLELVRLGRELPPLVLADLRRLTEGTGHSLHAFFGGIVGAPAEPPEEAFPGEAALVSAAARAAIASRGALAESEEGELDRRTAELEVPRPAFDAEAVAELLGPGGPLGGEPGWELRESQQQMCRAVAQAFEREVSLMVEAGTGTGKSLAYLLPALAWAEAKGQRVCVSTYTINLQEQLLHKDLPLAARILQVPPRAVLLKGRSHYLGRLRWEQLLAGTRADLEGGAPELEGIDPGELLVFKLKVTVWLGWTRTGDRDELRLFGQEEKIWRAVASEWSDCRSADCVDGPRPCFYHLSRRRAASADIVVVNHALLLADAFNESGGLPLGRHLIVDEAHHLEEAATRGLTEEVREEDLLGLLALAGAASPGRAPGAELRRLRESTIAVCEGLRDACRRLMGQEVGRELRLDSRLRAGRLFAPVREAAESAAASLERLSEAEGAVVGPRLRLMVQALLAEDPERVVWASFGRDARVIIRSAPIEVAAALAEKLFAGKATTVMTSATLALNGSFEYVRRRTGLPSSRLEELVLESPFDYLNQALLCLPDDMPLPGEPAFLDRLTGVVEGIARGLSGRTLVLFTSSDQLHQVAGRLRLSLESEGLEVLAQGRGTGNRRQLAERFAAHPDAVLLGTSSFWEGLDLPGEALAAVVIVRLPFRPPDDPVMRARGDRLRDPFLELFLPEAVLRLKQGFGRLIRRAQDRGAVVILDGRVLSRAYGSAFLDSLPECASWTGAADAIPDAVVEWVAGG
jgi:Rad3-related DNA helicase/DNA polymerase III epsilon subunit-like protein